MLPKDWKNKATPEKIDCLAEQVFNHIPTRLNAVDCKLKFILAFLAILVTAFGLRVGIEIVRTANALW